LGLTFNTDLRALGLALGCVSHARPGLTFNTDLRALGLALGCVSHARPKAFESGTWVLHDCQIQENLV